MRVGKEIMKNLPKDQKDKNRNDYTEELHDSSSKFVDVSDATDAESII